MKNEFTKEQIRRAKLLFEVLYPNDFDNLEKIFYTSYGKKSNTGIINTILTICFDTDLPKEL